MRLSGLLSVDQIVSEHPSVSAEQVRAVLAGALLESLSDEATQQIQDLWGA
jgi:uncharacterized protein (DUF433 family)